jgi:hypothetical protein
MFTKKNNSYHTKQFFNYPNKVLMTHMKSAYKMKNKLNGLSKKNISQMFNDESNEDKSKTEYTCEHSRMINDINNDVCKNVNQSLQKSLENIKIRMKNILNNIKMYNKGKE